MNLFFEEMNRFDSFNDGNREDEVSGAITVWKKNDRGSAILWFCAGMRLIDAWGFALIKHASLRRAKSTDLVQKTGILVLSYMQAHIDETYEPMCIVLYCTVVLL
jgi:hypothetical protein